MGGPRADRSAAAEQASRSPRGIETILALTDFSAHGAAAVRRAAQLAAQHGARLRVVHVVAPPLLTAVEAWRGSAEARERMQWADAELVARHGRALSGEQGSLEIQVLVGAEVEEILRLSGEGDLLVLGSRGANPVKDLLLGSTATRLLTRCERPMLVVKLHRCDRYRRILVPVDLQDDRREALQAARVLAQGGEVHVVHAYEAHHESMLRRAGLDAATLRRARQDARAKVQARLSRMLGRSAERGARPLHRHLKRGHPVQVTLAAESRIHADLIVMSKRSRSKVEDALLGSTTKRVVHEARCDVLVVPLIGRGDASSA